MNEVARWFLKKDPTQLAQGVRTVATRLWKNADQDRTGMHRMARLYGNLPTLGLSPRSYRRRAAGEANRLSFNVVQAVSDAYVALLTKDQPKASFVTAGADWDLQQKAQLLEKFSDGALYETELYDKAPLIALHSAIWPYGFVTSYVDDIDPDEPKLAVDHGYPWELLTDDTDAMYGKPRVEVRIRHEDRYELEQRYPNKKQAIRDATNAGFEYEGDWLEMETTSDRLIVIEIWRLPRSTKSGDGRYVKMVGSDVILENAEYKYLTFPNVRLYQKDPLEGNVGTSLAETLSGIQFEINSLLLRVQKSYIAGAGHWLVNGNAEINTNQINDVIGSIVRYKGTMPTFQQPQTVTPDQYAHLDRLWGKGFESAGMSPQAAMAQKPAGLNSGKAQLVYADVQSDRFKPAYRAYQNWVMRLSRQNIHLAEEIAEKRKASKKGDLVVRSPVSRSIGAAVKWGDAKLAESQYLIKMYPTNALANDPAALMQAVTDMMSGGVIQSQDGARLLSMNPDLETFFSYANASYDLTMKMVDSMLHSGTFEAPEPEMNLEKAIQDVQMAYLKARLDGAPKNRLDLLMRWMVLARDQLAKKTPPAPPPMMPNVAAPPGPAGLPPGAPPVPPQPNPVAA